MRTKATSLVVGMALNLAFLSVCEGQTDFKNLGFELAVPVPVSNDPLGRVYAQNALPHWTSFIGTNEQTAVFFNNRPTGSSSIAIVDYRCAFAGYIAGRYTPLLEAHGPRPGIVVAPSDVSLVQTAFVRWDAKSLQLLARATPEAAFHVSLGGLSLDLISYPTGSNCMAYSA